MSELPPIPPTLDKRVERLERAVETMAYWLVSAQTGFGKQDADGIYAILRGERESNTGKERSS